MKYKSGFAHILLVLLAVGVVLAAVAYQGGILAGDKPPIGNLDSVDNKSCAVRGWAVDQDTPEKPVKVYVYRDGPVGVGTKVAEVDANTKRADISQSFKGNHGFVVTFDDTSEVKNAKEHKVYVYAISTSKNGKNTLISSAPRSISCEVLDACSLTSDKFSFKVNLTTADGKSTLNLDNVRVKIDLTDDAKANILKNHLCMPKDLPRTSSTQSGAVEFSSMPTRNYNVMLLVESLPKGYNLASGQSVTQTLVPVAPNPTNASQVQQLNYKIGKSQ